MNNNPFVINTDSSREQRCIRVQDKYKFSTFFQKQIFEVGVNMQVQYKEDPDAVFTLTINGLNILNLRNVQDIKNELTNSDKRINLLITLEHLVNDEMLWSRGSILDLKDYLEPYVVGMGLEYIAWL